jgi:hypothetical protein
MRRIPFKPDIAPSLQLKAKRAEPGGKRTIYLPHQGAREVARRRRQEERAQAKAASRS